jgi:uncharacterized repeat protein (TIGR03806 family)
MRDPNSIATLAGVAFMSACLLGCSPAKVEFQDTDAELLSTWGLMSADGKHLKLSENVIPYQLNSTLFTDYAHKLRTVTVPEGTNATANEDGTINFPIGTVISKTFFYPKTSTGLLKSDDKGTYFVPSISTHGGMDLSAVTLIETRLLVHRKTGWVALPYVWNDAQTEATLEITGDAKALVIADGDQEQNQEHSFTYIVPDKNQCAGCHATNATTRDINPIGPRIHNLNRTYDYGQRYDSASVNQLKFWQDRGLITLNQSPEKLPAMADWADTSLDTQVRARAYLDVNCGHCHNEKGPADTSGLFLDIATVNPVRLGRCKLPIAAGQGTGGNKFSIVPGHPETSILVYRMQSLDPGAMMPELGRSLAHPEGIGLIAEWITSMEGECAGQEPSRKPLRNPKQKITGLG